MLSEVVDEQAELGCWMLDQQLIASRHQHDEESIRCEAATSQDRRERRDRIGDRLLPTENAGKGEGLICLINLFTHFQYMFNICFTT